MRKIWKLRPTSQGDKCPGCQDISHSGNFWSMFPHFPFSLSGLYRAQIWVFLNGSEYRPALNFSYSSKFSLKELGIQPLELVQLDGTTFSVASTYHQKANISDNIAGILKISAPLEWRQKMGTSDMGHLLGEWDTVHSQSVSGGQKEEREKFDPFGRKSASLNKPWELPSWSGQMGSFPQAQPPR